MSWPYSRCLASRIEARRVSVSAGIHRAGRIVRGVDEHGLHVRVQRCLECLEVDLEAGGVGGDDGQVRAGAVHIRLVFGEVRGEGDDLVARLGHGPHGVGECARRTRGGEDVAAFVVHAEAAVQGVRDGGAYGGDAQRGGVAVDGDRVAMLVQIHHGVGEVARRGDGRITQGEVEDVLVADFRAALGGVFAQFADDGLAAQHRLVLLVDHRLPPVFVHFAVFASQYIPAGLPFPSPSQTADAEVPVSVGSLGTPQSVDGEAGVSIVCLGVSQTADTGTVLSVGRLRIWIRCGGGAEFG